MPPAILQIIGFAAVVVNMIPRFTDLDLTNTAVANKCLAMHDLRAVAWTAAAVFKIVRGTGHPALRFVETAVTCEFACAAHTAVRRMADITEVAMLAAILQIIRLTSLAEFMIAFGTRKVANAARTTDFAGILKHPVTIVPLCTANFRAV